MTFNVTTLLPVSFFPVSKQTSPASISYENRNVFHCISVTFSTLHLVCKDHFFPFCGPLQISWANQVCACAHMLTIHPVVKI